MSPLRNSTRLPRGRPALVAAALGVWLTAAAENPVPNPPGLPASAAEGSAALSFEQALRLAEAEAPALRAQQRAIAAAEHEVVPANALPDPQAFFGTSALPVNGAHALEFRAEPMSMQMIGVRQGA